jgi:hypothetical protein
MMVSLHVQSAAQAVKSDMHPRAAQAQHAANVGSIASNVRRFDEHPASSVTVTGVLGGISGGGGGWGSIPVVGLDVGLDAGGAESDNPTPIAVPGGAPLSVLSEPIRPPHPASKTKAASLGQHLAVDRSRMGGLFLGVRRGGALPILAPNGRPLHGTRRAPVHTFKVTCQPKDLWGEPQSFEVPVGVRRGAAWRRGQRLKPHGEEGSK